MAVTVQVSVIWAAVCQELATFYFADLKYLELSTKGMLALDIGIKNLAYCVGTATTISDVSGSRVDIQSWSLVNLTDLENTGKPVCYQCSKPAKAKAPLGLVCKKHIPKTNPQIYDEMTGQPITKQPTIHQLQAYLRAKNLDTRGARPVLLERVEAIATMPMVKVKSVMSFADNTCKLHDAIRGWIERDFEKLSGVKHVYIEHQPVLKNPVMKTVQILIFATLRDRYLAEGEEVEFHFVHAGKKVKGAEVGDAGYKDRKAGGEARVKEFLGKSLRDRDREWLAWWQMQPKKDDLADTLCMLLDSLA